MYKAVETRSSFDGAPFSKPGPGVAIPHPRKRPWWTRIGRESLIFILTGCVAIVAALGLLAFLWGASDVDSRWRSVILSKRATQIVTISSAVIRTSISVQSGVLTAIIASVVLEQYDVLLKEAALLSIVRATTVGPHYVFWPIMRTLRQSRWFLVPSVSLAIVVTVASQFISTILLTDFGMTTIAGNISSFDVAYTSDMHPWGTNQWLSRPPSYPRFAEYVDPPLKGQDFVDTGPTYRAFLPIQNTIERSTLRAYDGPASILDSRVSCVRPSINISSLVVSPTAATNYDSYDTLLVSGTIYMNDTRKYPMLRSPYYLKPREFSSLVSVTGMNEGFMGQSRQANKTQTEWATSIHYLFEKEWWQSMDSIIGSEIPWSNITDRYLIVNTTGNVRDWVAKTGLKLPYKLESGREFKTDHEWVKNITSDDNPAKWKMMGDGPWSKATSGKGGVLSISFTLCFTHSWTGDYAISLASTRDGPEPVLEQRSDKKFGTGLIQRQLGATKNLLTLAQRNVFALLPPQAWRKLNSSLPDGDIQYGTELGRDLSTFYDLKNNTFATGILTSEDTGDNKARYVVNPAHATLFQGAIRATNNPAIALQALITVLTSMNYYNCFYAFTNTAPGTMSSSSEAQAPVRWTGFIIVMVIVWVHLSLMAVFIVLFSRVTEHSTIGNSWQAVSQVVSVDTSRMVEGSADMTDREVRAQAERAGVRTRYRLGRGIGVGRSQISAI
ncbi:hypothetical protein CC86DRAFT_35644 [Ophiobolus disseminans]|uniref:Uncharacterized protein n=1 Tax=Ophiobolus disseminans TaxID=1469910 RepID=A0A6A6ZXR5_9PLEO|nr:hypothetical protein CC86DRAFT_35644 [Ophiobolus disseminans]